jgi:HPt (histidine-containing phosphotransfer) domain-containing protein
MDYYPQTKYSINTGGSKNDPNLILPGRGSMGERMAENIIIGANGAVYINVEEAIKRVMNNGKLLAKLLTKFKTDNIKLLDETNEFIAAGDYEKAKASIHTLKGIAANLAFTELYRQTVELEAQIKNGSANPDTQESVKKCFAETLVHIDEVIAQYGG